MPTPADWERTYRDGRHRELWDTPWPSPELAGALAALGHRARAVDLGCGTGSDAVLLAQHVTHVFGVDVSPTAISLASTKADEAAVSIDFAVADVMRLPVEDGSLDLATDRGCLHYLDADEQMRYGRELERALRPGAVALIRGMAAPERHKSAVTEASIRSLFAPLSFEVSRIVAFTMLGSRSSAPGTLALLQHR